MAKHRRRWLVVFAAFFVGFLTDGCTFTYGMFLIEFLDEFEDTRAVTSIIGSLAVSLMNLTGPVAGLMADMFGHRVVVVVGALVSFGGILGASFARNLFTLALCYGFIGGLGFGLMYLPAHTCVIKHFEDKRALAMGISVCGSGTGTFVVGFLLPYLIDAYSWRGTILILAGLVLNGIPFGLLFFPKDDGETETAQVFDSPCKESATQDTPTYSNVSLWCKCKRVFIENGRLLKDVRCICFLLSTAVISLPYLIPFTLLPDQVIQLGMTKYQASWLVSAIGISNIIGRVAIGWIGDRQFINRMLLFQALMLFLGISTILSPFLTTFETKMMYSCMFGFLIGGYVTLLSVVLADMFGPELIEKSFGLALLALGIPIMFGAPLGGWIFDQTGSYDITFIVAGVEFLVSGLILFIPWSIQRLRQRTDNITLTHCSLGYKIADMKNPSAST